MKIILSILFWGIVSTVVWAQDRTVDYSVSLSGFVSTKDNLPFWAVSNRYGLMPDGRGGLLEVGVFSDFTDKHKINFAYGVSGAGFLSDFDNNILLDQLYISGRWRNLRLDLGMIHRDTEYEGISSTNGDMIWSNNSRTLPGYNLRSDYIDIPWTNKVLSFKFNWADYMMIDDRYVEDTRLHNKSVFLKIKPAHRWEIIVGLEHWVQWGGTSPTLGKQPSSFKDYLRIVCGQEGGEGASTSDVINALGNHLGREHFRINYLADNYTLTFYHDIPFEDASGTDFRSFPDGTYSFYYGAHNKNQWVSDVIYEFYYTKYQSGRYHDRPINPDRPEDGKKVLGGNDNYFNNGEYRSGWTYYGRTIGTPLMTPLAPNVHGITMGIYNNRIIGHHLGLKGYAFQRIPYKAMLTYTLNYGTYGKPLPDLPVKQCSFGLEAGIPDLRHIPFHIDLGVYGDFGRLLTNNFGVTVKLTRKAVLWSKK